MTGALPHILLMVLVYQGQTVQVATQEFATAQACGIAGEVLSAQAPMKEGAGGKLMVACLPKGLPPAELAPKAKGKPAPKPAPIPKPIG